MLKQEVPQQVPQEVCHLPVSRHLSVGSSLLPIC